MAKIEKAYKYFDLDTMEKKSETVSIDFTAAETYADAVARLGNDETVLTAAINAHLKKTALKAAGSSVKEKGASSAVVMKFAAPWRMSPPFDTIDDRGEQTKAILEFFKTTPAFITAIKAASLKAAESDDEEETADAE